MQRVIELKHVGPKEHVRNLVEDLIDHLESKLQHFAQNAVSIHALFEENGSHALYRIALTCHVPGRVVAAHKESRDAGLIIRKAFAEIERQLEKHNITVRRTHLQRRLAQQRRQAALANQEALSTQTQSPASWTSP